MYVIHVVSAFEHSRHPGGLEPFNLSDVIMFTSFVRSRFLDTGAICFFYWSIREYLNMNNLYYTKP